MYSSKVSRRRSIIATSAAIALLSIGTTACGGGESDQSPDTGGRVKNAPLNACISVMSGGRPSPGVTIPRCIPTTLPGKPFTMTTVPRKTTP